MITEIMLFGSKSKMRNMDVIIIIAVIAIGAYLFWKKSTVNVPACMSGVLPLSANPGTPLMTPTAASLSNPTNSFLW